MLFNVPFVAILATLASVVNAIPVEDAEARSLEARVAPNNMVKITSTTDYCMIVPKTLVCIPLGLSTSRIVADGRIDAAH